MTKMRVAPTSSPFPSSVLSAGPDGDPATTSVMPSTVASAPIHTRPDTTS